MAPASADLTARARVLQERHAELVAAIDVQHCRLTGLMIEARVAMALADFRTHRALSLQAAKAADAAPQQSAPQPLRRPPHLRLVASATGN